MNSEKNCPTVMRWVKIRYSIRNKIDVRSKLTQVPCTKLRLSAQNRLGDGEKITEALTGLCPDTARFVNGVVLAVDGEILRGCTRWTLKQM